MSGGPAEKGGSTDGGGRRPSGREHPESSSGSGRHRAHPLSPKLGRPLPVPAWALVVVGGAIAAPLGPEVARASGPAGTNELLAVLVPALFGAACGTLAALATGRMRRGLALLGGAIGAGAGGFVVLGARVHEVFVLPAIVILFALPAAVVARAVRLPAGRTTMLCSISLTMVAAGALPLGITLRAANAHFFGLPGEQIATALAAIAGGLAWVYPASVRVGGTSD